MNNMPDKNLNNLKALLSAMQDDHLTKTDFVDHFEKVVQLVKNIEAKNIKEFDTINEVLVKFTEKIKTDNSNEIGVIKKDVNGIASKLLSDYNAKSKEIDAKIKSIKDGKDADEENIIGRVLEKIELPEIEEIENSLPRLGAQIRDGLELLQGEERLDISAVKGFDELKEELKGSGKNISFVGGARGINMFIDGVKKGMMSSFNLVEGSNVSINYTKTNGRNDIIISATGGTGGMSILSATGSIDDSNTTFTFLSEPTLVIVNGATYRHGYGCSIATTTVTLDNPVGTGGDIYALGA